MWCGIIDIIAVNIVAWSSVIGFLFMAVDLLRFSHEVFKKEE